MPEQSVQLLLDVEQTHMVKHLLHLVILQKHLGSMQQQSGVELFLKPEAQH